MPNGSVSFRRFEWNETLTLTGRDRVIHVEEDDFDAATFVVGPAYKANSSTVATYLYSILEHTQPDPGFQVAYPPGPRMAHSSLQP